MSCPHCQSTATVERPDRTELGYRRFRCRTCKRGFNERTGTPYNRLQYSTDVVCLVVLWRFRYKLSLRDLAEMFLQRGLSFTHEAVRDWESKLAPRFCHVFDEIRAFLRPQCYRNQLLTLAQRRRIHQARFTELMGMMAVA
jgi:putative transposase